MKALKPEVCNQMLKRFSRRVLRRFFLAAYRTGCYTIRIFKRAEMAEQRAQFKTGCLRALNSLRASAGILILAFRGLGFSSGMRLLGESICEVVHTKKFRAATAASAMLALFAVTPLFSMQLAVFSGGLNAYADTMAVSSASSVTSVSSEAVPSAPVQASQPAPAVSAVQQPAPAVSSASVRKASAKKTVTAKKAAAKKTRSASRNASISRSIVSRGARFAGDPFRYPQCVWYAWGRAKEATGIALQFASDSGRSAKYWLNIVQQTGNVKVGRNINDVRADSIAVFGRGGGGNGHVAYIEKVNTDSNGRPVSIVISESNYLTRYPAQTTMPWEEFLSRSNGSLKGYIYLG